MTDTIAEVDLIDRHVDTEIAACLNLKQPRSFFLFAGAGSGKTKSLVDALKHIRKAHGPELRLHNRRVAVVTYTKKARDEIISRLEFDPLFAVSTIHAFAWMTIQGFNHDIREWLRTNLVSEIAVLRDKETRSRSPKASAERQAEIESKTRRLQQLDLVSTFVYNPDGENRGKGSVIHSEVIKMTADFIREKPILQKVIRDGFPFILVDESQDTNKHVIDAIFTLQAAHPNAVGVGLFGDMMQRIYSDGVSDLSDRIPPEWATPVKKLNFRCPRRVVTLLNKVREATDKQDQTPKSKAIDGLVRLFVVSDKVGDKQSVEQFIADQMADAGGDPLWKSPEDVKSLILEHKMAARRLGFFELYDTLYSFTPFRTGLRDGTLPLLNFFATRVLPLVDARDDNFAIMRILTNYSPLMQPEMLRSVADENAHLVKMQNGVTSLLTLFSEGASPSFLQVLQVVQQHDLFTIPDILRPALAGAIVEEADDDTTQNERSERDTTLASFLSGPFQQLQPYLKYSAGLAQFDTHQGVKGLEFERVRVVMDDSEAAGFAFKYEKLFSTSAPEDGVTSATRRLFYVTCSRAQKSLCLIAYTSDPRMLKDTVQQRGWFDENEVIIVEAP